LEERLKLSTRFEMHTHNSKNGSLFLPLLKTYICVAFFHTCFELIRGLKTYICVVFFELLKRGDLK